MTAPITPKDPTSTKLSDHRIGKGYSYLFAALLTALLASQSIAIEFSTDKSGDFKIAIASKEISLQFFYPCAALIGGILGLPTDALALALGQILSKGRE